ncbi:hypothetical protein R2R70_20455, partial [Cobetia sp. SIMBA_158]|uniref:hypothetical protein n=1 Tax=Cobetia sp. SIMBA_158 TaxID=3081617 RepID=UPI0039819357
YIHHDDLAAYEKLVSKLKYVFPYTCMFFSPHAQLNIERKNFLYFFTHHEAVGSIEVFFSRSFYFFFDLSIFY